jgi:hypothetical protein
MSTMISKQQCAQLCKQVETDINYVIPRLLSIRTSLNCKDVLTAKQEIDSLLSSLGQTREGAKDLYEVFNEA